MAPLVSVIIPTYNRAELVIQAVESVLAQRHSTLELIVIDDGSSDHTAQLLENYAGRLAYHYQPRQGVSNARNHGVALSRGKYICFLDSDDLWQPEKLSVQLAFMEANPQIPLCYTDEIWIRNGVRVNPHKKHGKHSGWIFERCLPLCIISPSSAMFRRELLMQTGGFDETLPACEDYDMWLRITKNHPVHFIPQALIVKRGGHEDQLSGKYWGNDRFRVRALEKLLQAGELTLHQRQLVIDNLVHRCRIIARGCFKRGNMAQGKEYLEKVRQAANNG